MAKKLRFARQFSNGINATQIVTELALERFNGKHLLLLETIAEYISLPESEAVKLVGENVMRVCFNSGLTNMVFFEEDTLETSLYDIKGIPTYDGKGSSKEVFLVLDFGGVALLEAYSTYPSHSLTVPKMYHGSYNKYRLNTVRYLFYQDLIRHQAVFEMKAQPTPINLFKGVLTFHSMITIKRQVEKSNKKRVLLGVMFFDNSIFPVNKDQVSILYSLEQLLRGEHIKKVCAAYGMKDMESDFYILMVCDDEEQAMRIATYALHMAAKDAVNKFRFIIRKGETYNYETFIHHEAILKYDDGIFKKIDHHFFPE